MDHVFPACFRPTVNSLYDSVFCFLNIPFVVINGLEFVFGFLNRFLEVPFLVSRLISRILSWGIHDIGKKHSIMCVSYCLKNEL